MTTRLPALFTLAAFVALLAGVGGCSVDAPLPRAPGAVAVVVARTADVLAIESVLVKSGLVSSSVLAPLGPALVADAPMVASVMPSGVVVVATRVSKGAAATMGTPRVVVGDTVAVTIMGRVLLARVDGNRALVAFDVEPADEASTAALLEIMAADKAALTPPLPSAGSVGVDVEPAASPIGAAHATVKLDGTALVAAVVAPHAPPGVRDALAAPSPSWACALDEGAAAVLAIPPLDPQADAASELFSGRMLVAVYPPAAGSDEEREGMASVVVAGAPNGTKARDDLLTSLREGGAQIAERSETLPDGRTVKRVDVNARRVLRAVVADDRFALAVGAAAPIDRVARGECPATDRSKGAAPIVRLDGAKLQRLLLPMLVTPDVILRALAAAPGDADAIPLARLRGVQRLDVDARTEGDAVHVDARLVLATTNTAATSAGAK